MDNQWAAAGERMKRIADWMSQGADIQGIERDRAQPSLLTIYLLLILSLIHFIRSKIRCQPCLSCSSLAPATPSHHCG
jgi:hypothetical protein